jgi:hypothetical protein
VWWGGGREERKRKGRREGRERKKIKVPFENVKCHIGISFPSGATM